MSDFAGSNNDPLLRFKHDLFNSVSVSTTGWVNVLNITGRGLATINLSNNNMTGATAIHQMIRINVDGAGFKTFNNGQSNTFTLSNIKFNSSLVIDIQHWTTGSYDTMCNVIYGFL